MTKISKSDRSALVKLAASLPKGSPEKRAILSGLKKVSLTLKGGPPPNEKVQLTIGQARGPDLFKLSVLASSLQDYNDLLDEVLDAMGGDDSGGYNDKFSRLERAREALKDSQKDVAELERELKPLLAKAHTLRVDLSKFKGVAMHYVDLSLVDESGQKWYLDSGEDWVKE